MKKRLLFGLMVVMATGVIAKNVTGKVHYIGKGLPGVVVTDGRTFTETNDEGVYSLNTADDADFVFIVTPSGYVTSYETGTPCFYKSPDAKTMDFELHKFGVSKGRYTLFAIGDTQPGNDRAYARLEEEAFPELKEYAKTYTDKAVPVAGILLGDMVWDNLETYGRFKDDLKQLNYPVYPVIGNHDHEEMFADGRKSEMCYKQNFGPNYYAFNMGNDYYIVLDNIVYKGNRKYDEKITDEQLEWVREYTRYIPSGSRVVVAMHVPAYNYAVDKKLDGADRLMDILSAYQVTILSGHSHIHSNIQLRPNVFEHMVSSIGGAWWLWDSQYCKDGTPMGHQVFESSAKEVRNYFKSLHHPADYQLKIFPFGTFEGHADELCVKVWNWDKTWKVEWMEDGVKKGSMKQFTGADPDYGLYIEREEAQGKKRTNNRPNQNPFIFFSAKPSDKTKVVKVLVTDRFGKQYSAEYQL